MAAAAAALALGFGDAFWSRAEYAKYYTLNATLVAWGFFALLRWGKTLRPRDLYWAVAIFALASGNHLTIVGLLPALVLFPLLTAPRPVLRPLTLLTIAAIVLLGLSQYRLHLAADRAGRAVPRGARHQHRPAVGRHDGAPVRPRDRGVLDVRPVDDPRAAGLGAHPEGVRHPGAVPGRRRRHRAVQAESLAGPAADGRRSGRGRADGEHGIRRGPGLHAAGLRAALAAGRRRDRPAGVAATRARRRIRRRAHRGDRAGGRAALLAGRGELRARTTTAPTRPKRTSSTRCSPRCPSGPRSSPTNTAST